MEPSSIRLLSLRYGEGATNVWLLVISWEFSKVFKFLLLLWCKYYFSFLMTITLVFIGDIGSPIYGSMECNFILLVYLSINPYIPSKLSDSFCFFFLGALNIYLTWVVKISGNYMSLFLNPVLLNTECVSSDNPLGFNPLNTTDLLRICAFSYRICSSMVIAFIRMGLFSTFFGLTFFVGKRVLNLFWVKS